MIQIGVVGEGEASGDIYELAVKVGAEVAAAKAILVCGGLGGVMEGCARGAKERGGLTVGILPGMESSEANPYIDVKIVTAMSHARNAVIARTADVLIAIGGSYGTLSEVALALKLGKPVIVLETKESILKDIRLRGTLSSKTPVDAVRMAIEKAKR